MRDPWHSLAADLTALGIPVVPEFEPRARVFLEELRRWSAVGRLTGYQTEAEQVENLLLDSLLMLAVLPAPASPLLDIGTGPGVPGLILKLARPAWAVTLVEAHRRRANFVRHVIRTLELEGVEVYTARAEALATRRRLRGGFGTVTMRAVAAPATALALARPFLRPHGYLVLPLGAGVRPSMGIVREVTLARPAPILLRRRTFLIIEAAAVAANVPRGTREARGARPGGREPEGRGGEDDNRREPGRGTGRRGAADPPRGRRSPGQRDNGRLA